MPHNSPPQQVPHHTTPLLFRSSLHLHSPPTAVRLLDEFVQLAEGDTIVQNGATSNVGRVS